LCFNSARDAAQSRRFNAVRSAIVASCDFGIVMQRARAMGFAMRPASGLDFAMPPASNLALAMRLALKAASLLMIPLLVQGEGKLAQRARVRSPTTAAIAVTVH